MTDINILSEKIKTGAFDARLKEVYNQTEEKLNINKKRLVDCIEGYETYFKTQGEGCIFSAPGRTEIGGNHTDHQHGRVLAGSVDLDVIATAVPNGTNKICIKSEGFPEDIIDLGVLTPVESEKNTSASLIRGVAAEAVARGFKVSGFNAYTTSNVLKGSGLSSSAAFEVLVGVMVDHFFCNDSLGGVEIAKIGQKAENEFFGKPCGLM
ncbi:MAG: galactokinase family protein, partial [Oscillospiraceae bacterium]